MGKAWYVLHIYSGYEKKVEESIHALIKEAQMNGSKIADILFQIKVPLREVSEVKNGKKKVVSQKFLPGYVLLEMNLDGNNWQEIYSVINELAAKGVAIIMVSSELPEVLGMSDRIMVVHEGKVTGIINAAEADQEKVMTLATGGTL